MMWGELWKHQKEEHGRTYRILKTPVPFTPPIATNATETFHQIRTLAKEMLIQIDDERNKITNRLKELDDMAAKYKHLV